MCKSVIQMTYFVSFLIPVMHGNVHDANIYIRAQYIWLIHSLI